MKKLNRKGFTLVELLAVIVILAIVVGITLVTVLPTLKKSRQEAFNLTAQTAADYFEKQYQLYIVGETDNMSNTLKTFVGAKPDNNNSISIDLTSTNASLITDAGLKPANYIKGKAIIDTTNGRVCVMLDASTNTTATATDTKPATNNLANNAEAGEYYDVTGPATSSSCTAGQIAAYKG